MKNILKLIPILLFVFTLSCEQDDDNARFSSDPTTGWVEFSTTTSSTTISTQTESLSLPVILRVPVYKNGITVTYALEPVIGDFSNIVTTNGNTLEFLSNELPGPDGTPSIKNIELTFQNLSSTTPLTAFDVVLTAVDVDGVNIGLGENSITRYRVSTPCPTIFSDSYNVDVTALGGTAPSHNVQLVPVPGTDNQFTVSSTWGPNFVGWATGNPGFNGQFPYPAIITVNPNLTVDVIGTGSPALSGGSGTYDTCSDVFLITLTQDLFTTEFTVDIVMSND